MAGMTAGKGDARRKGENHDALRENWPFGDPPREWNRAPRWRPENVSMKRSDFEVLLEGHKSNLTGGAE